MCMKNLCRGKSTGSMFLAQLSTKCTKLSFCDHECLLSVVHNFFKHLLLLNHWDNLDQTWQEWSMAEALPKMFKRLNSTNNSGCHGNKNEIIAKSWKIFFSETR